MKNLTTLLAALLISAASFAQQCYNPNMNAGKAEFNKGNYETALSYFENAKQCGDKPGVSEANMWIGKCDDYLPWKTIIGTDNREYLSASIVAKSGCIISGGDYRSTDNKHQYDLLVCTSNSGEILWKKTYGYHSDISSIIETEEGTFIIGGSINNEEYNNKDAWLIKIDKDGNIIWKKTFGDKNKNEIDDICLGENNSIIAIGSTYLSDNNKSDAWIIKIDASGSVIWEKTFGSKHDDFATSITNKDDESYFITIYTPSLEESNNGSWIIEIDSKGNKIKEISLNSFAFDYINSIEKTSNNNYVLVGFANNNDYDAWVVLLDESGLIIWDNYYGGQGYQKAYSIIEDNGFIFSGYTDSKGNGLHDGWVVKTDYSGNILWEKTFGGTENDNLLSISKFKNTGYIISGTTNSFEANNPNFWIQKIVK